MSPAALATRGSIGLVGVQRPDARASFNLTGLQRGHMIKGICEGDSDPDESIPPLIEHFMAGCFPANKLATFYAFAALDQALDDQASGKAVKPILRFA